MPWPDRRLLDLFGISVPILQAPMANSTGIEVALGVAEAGGLAALPCAMLSPETIETDVALYRAHASRRHRRSGARDSHHQCADGTPGPGRHEPLYA